MPGSPYRSLFADKALPPLLGGQENNRKIYVTSSLIQSQTAMAFKKDSQILQEFLESSLRSEKRSTKPWHDIPLYFCHDVS